MASPELELDHDGDPDAGFILPQIGTEPCASGHAGEAGRRGQERAWTNVVSPTTDPAPGFGIVLGNPLSPGVMPPRPDQYGTLAWRYPNSERKVMYCLGIQSKVIEVSQALYGIARVLGKVGRAGDSVGSIDGGQQREIASRIVHCAATNGDGVLILLEPKPVVEHPAGEGLLAARSRIVAAIHVVVDCSTLCADKRPLPPYSHPRSPVSENAILSSVFSGWS